MDARTRCPPVQRELLRQLRVNGRAARPYAALLLPVLLLLLLPTALLLLLFLALAALALLLFMLTDFVSSYCATGTAYEGADPRMAYR
jgi:hypothetical protein